MKSATLPPPGRPLGSGFRTRVTRSAGNAGAARPFPRNFLSVLDLDVDAWQELLRTAVRLKKERRLGRRAPTAQALSALHVALLFDKPSLRTRATFEIAVRELGGDVIVPTQDAALGSRETAADVARNLERWVACAVIRTFQQARLVEFAQAAPKLRVINALTDEEHPCQAAADLLTLQEQWGSFEGRTLTFVGDGNNVATSLVHAAMLSGLNMRIASPEGYELPAHVVADAARVAQKGATLTLFRDPVEAVRGADAVYTDVWTSMGQEQETQRRRRIFMPYQVNAALMAHAAPDALFMHCLPAHRGEEVSDEVMDAPCSVVFEQSENRLHVQKALLLLLLARNGRG
ncbi:MAG TPA: ornithine carbamoyltransferase [Vicinamibacterales bacterium]